ncbi:MAG: sulfotransferase family protein [Gammaproteobacteria bacterium]|nr:sulfotransferase family protein [Gammaproteobacteria bacterium]MDH5629247.1 sulfotransferase family protein [Gammaproteobacteria bacterium]
MSNGLKILKVNRLFQPLIPFYRKYPFKSPVSFNSADDRGCIDFELPFFYNRIPKAANSTVMATLASIRFNSEIISAQAKKMFRYPSSLTSNELKKFDDLFKFTVVRDPFTRVLSAYLNKIKKRPKKNALIKSFDEFINKLENGDLYINAHWAPQTALLLIPVESFDFIGKMENFDQDMNHILKNLNQPVTETTIKNTLHHATGANDKLKKYYSVDLAKRVVALYQSDFDAFNYDDQYIFELL